ncbi:hypothetical protein H2O64_14280 [Kordia sp. YSTF-M3]|uniref:T9SS-like galactose binding domain-containing protein n=1 Tax=Kordia aestuariivivens TaxID=2759037 RepID=A0ABR7QBU5_9FLAO|nr:hypothetical protein [Kordia aestuariivivens]MBC8755841.1 hypothetical protein [Kordia aestuariivivens]
MRRKLLFAFLIITNIIWANTDLAAPANDNFANAIPLTCGNNYTSSTVEATLDENNAPDATTPQAVDLDAPNIWYSYTGSGTPETITLDLCASGYDTSYLVYTGTSGNLTLVAANDFNDTECGPGYRSYGTFESDGNTTYYITITGYNSSDVGDVDLTVSCFPSDIILIPDANFEQALIDLSLDTGIVNGYISSTGIDQINDLNISNSNISDLSGIENFTGLQFLNVSNNNLTSLPLTAITNITSLNCSFNAITLINLRNQTNLTSLQCNNNDGLSVLFANNGNNTNITLFDARNTANLACIEVDNAAYSAANWTNRDANVQFSEMCNQTTYTYVPDDNFEQALIDLGYDTSLDDYVLTANINTVGSLTISSRNITDLTGIEGFTALTFLSCSNNMLTTIDITNNSMLGYFYCKNNQLTTIDVSQNPVLETFWCYENSLTSIDVTQNSILRSFLCFDNELTSIDVTQNLSLRSIAFGENPIEHLDLSNNSQLTSINASGGSLSSLDLRNGNNVNINFNLAGFDVTNNPNLSCVDVDDAAYSTANWTSIDPGLTFSENCTAPIPPNDECADTVNIPISDASCNNIVAGTLAGATDSGLFQCFGGTDFSDVWFSFVATETTHEVKILNTTGANSRVFHTVIDAQTYNCTNITDAVYCTDALERQATGLTIGNTYYIQVFTDLANSTETFDICITSSVIPGLTFVPDNNFEQALIDLSLDDVLDDYVVTSNIDAVNDLNIRNLGIFDLTGIEDFAALEILNCGLNFLGELDLSNNTSLNYLIADNSALVGLNVQNGNNTNVTTFITLGNVDLFCIEVDDAAYSTANWTTVETGTSFSTDCGFLANDNCVDAINIPMSDALCLNAVTGTLAQSTDSNEFKCFGNTASFSDVWYSFVATETTHNITFFNLTGPPNTVFHAVIDAETYNCGNIMAAIACSDSSNSQLTGLTVGNTYYIQVFSSLANVSATFDLCVSTNTIPGQTYVPDDNFEQALIDLGYDTTLDNYVTTANINTVTSLNVVGKNIASLTGLQSFTALQSLDFSINNVTTVDLTQNAQLRVLLLTGNSLATINVSQNPLLRGLTVEENLLTTIDVTQNPLLESLNISKNLFTSIDVTQNAGLTNLDVGENSLSQINVTQNPVLAFLTLDKNNFSAVDVTNNPLLSSLSVEENSLTTIDITQNPVLLRAYFGYNQLTTIDVSQNLALETLSVTANSQISTIDVSVNAALKNLRINSTQISEVNVSNNLNLEGLSISNCPITGVDLTANVALQSLGVVGSQIRTIDVSQNPAFVSLFCSNTSTLTSVNIQNGNNTNVTTFFALNTPNLTCVQVDDVAYSSANWSNIDAGTNFSTDCGFLENDNCVDAINIPMSDALCLNAVTGTLAQSTDSNEFKCYGNTASFSDVWYSFVATETTHNITFFNLTGPPNTVFHAVIDAETYNCGNITAAIACSDSSNSQLTGLTVGNTYYIQVFSSLANVSATFDLCVSSLAIPGLTYVPDNNFEQALIDLSLDDVLDDYVVTSNINTVNDLNIRNLGIFDLTGIEDFAALEILNCGLNFLGELDLSNNTNLNYLIADNSALVGLNVKNGNNTNVTTFITLGNVDLFCIQVDDAAYSTANWTIIEPLTTFSEYCGDPIQVAAKIYLQGAMLQHTDGFMRTDLKDNSYISTTSPYTDGIAILASDPVFTATGQNKIVDWVWIELRDATDPTMIIDGKSALLQRDGDIVEALVDDATTPVRFSKAPGDYYVVIKHRNHLGIMSSNALSLSDVATTVDFTNSNNQITYGANAQTTFGMPTNTVGMWSGNVNGDTVVQYAGTTPDTPAILSTILNDAGNFLNFPTYVLNGYNTNDINMDGTAQYTGTTPDTPFILQNILAHPGNFLNFSTYQIIEQLPENE